MKKQKQRGITLIALIITIILLLILAGIAISSLTGSGLLSKSTEAEFKTKMREHQEETNLYIYEKYIENTNLDLRTVNSGEPLISAIQDEIVTDIEESDVTIDIKDVLTTIKKKEKEYLVIYKGEMCYVSSDNVKNNEQQKKWAEELGITIIEYTKPTGIVIKNGDYELVNGIYLCTPKLDDGFIPEYTRYLEVDGDGSLVPGNWMTKNPTNNWYSYKDKKWANIYVEKEGVESYYVWIPRYAYKIADTTAGNQRTDVKFINLENKFIDAETGEETEWTDLSSQGYQIPEAFWVDLNADGTETEDERLAGYWISKYELSELSEFKIDYALSAGTSAFTVSEFTNNITAEVDKYTYAINGKIVHESKTLETYKFTEVKKNVYNYINVTALDADGRVLGSMTKSSQLMRVNEPELAGFDPDTTFYVYWDEDGNEHNEIPISQSAPSNWHDYSEAKWANIVTRNNGLESYFVWIPRYQYKLNTTTERTDVEFISGTSTETITGYAIPEAFTTQTDDGDVELKGYWISKYELTSEATETKLDAQITGSLNTITVKDMVGTLITEKEEEGIELIYEYYLNGIKYGEGTTNTESYEYTGLNEKTTYTVNIIVREKSSNKYVGAITKKVETKSPNKPVLEGFVESRTYYVLYDNDGNMTIGDNVKQDGSNMPSGWYDYGKSKWANIVVTDGTVENGQIKDATSTSYFVWIPRYEYKVNESTTSSSNQRVDINFIEGISTETSTGYEIPEAFTWDNGDETVELMGYWISKYELN